MMQNLPNFTFTLPTITLQQLQNPLANLGYYYNNNNDNAQTTTENPPVSDFSATVQETETQAHTNTNENNNTDLENIDAMDLYNQVQACFNLGSILSKMQGQPIDPTQQLLQNLSSFLQMNPQFLEPKQ